MGILCDRSGTAALQHNGSSGSMAKIARRAFVPSLNGRFLPDLFLRGTMNLMQDRIVQFNVRLPIGNNGSDL